MVLKLNQLWKDSLKKKINLFFINSVTKMSYIFNKIWQIGWNSYARITNRGYQYNLQLTVRRNIYIWSCIFLRKKIILPSSTKEIRHRTSKLVRKNWLLQRKTAKEKKLQNINIAGKTQAKQSNKWNKLNFSIKVNV